MSYIELKNVTKKYLTGDTEIIANQNISFEIEKGEFVIILGPSGAGKSTILNILGGMDKSDEGQVIIDGVDIEKFDETQLTKYRREDVGFVFQFYNLVPNLTAQENIELSTEVADDSMEAQVALDLVGLSKRKNNFPSQLSGGEQQRVSIARAIAKKPKLLLCDEPTGALDQETGKNILKLLQKANKENNETVVIITHNSLLAPIADRVVVIQDAKVKSVELNSQPVSIEQLNW